VRRIWQLTIVVALVAMSTFPAGAAPSGAEPVSSEEVLVELLDPGRDWYSGDAPVWHVRGWTGVYATVEGSDELISGTGTVVASWNVNLAAWAGNLWGTVDYVSDRFDDSGWEGTWTATWTGPGTWSGPGVARGYGEFEGMVWKFEVSNLPGAEPPVDMTSGYVFTPGTH
jgi:hypothetical protein